MTCSFRGTLSEVGQTSRLQGAKQETKSEVEFRSVNPRWRRKEAAMNRLVVMQARQVKKFARFLEEHPGFSPELVGQDANVCGFRVGHCLLSVDEMERLIDTPVEAQSASLLQVPLMTSNRRLP
jgi:hypothetical protein